MPIQWHNTIPPGYHRAANVIIDYDRAYHAFYGLLLACDKCGATVLETAYVVHDNWHVELAKLLAAS